MRFVERLVHELACLTEFVHSGQLPLERILLYFESQCVLDHLVHDSVLHLPLQLMVQWEKEHRTVQQMVQHAKILEIEQCLLQREQSQMEPLSQTRKFVHQMLNGVQHQSQREPTKAMLQVKQQVLKQLKGYINLRACARNQVG